jgi:hypothetical protein
VHRLFNLDVVEATLPVSAASVQQDSQQDHEASAAAPHANARGAGKATGT